MARLSFPRSIRTTSAATMTMLMAIIASTGRDGSVTHPIVAQVKVMECATVKAVIAFTSLRQSRTISIRAGDEEQVIEAEGDVLDAVPRHRSRIRPRCFAMPGSLPTARSGVSRAVQLLPSAKATRTSASVMVFCSPSISTVLAGERVERAHAPGLHHCVAGRMRNDRRRRLDLGPRTAPSAQVAHCPASAS